MKKIVLCFISEHISTNSTKKQVLYMENYAKENQFECAEIFILKQVKDDDVSQQDIKKLDKFLEQNKDINDAAFLYTDKNCLATSKTAILYARKNFEVRYIL